MKFHILSDLHLEFGNLVLPKVDAQVLVLAGDIGLGLAGIEYAKQYAERYDKVFYVAGNHEYYGFHMEGVQADMREAVKDTNIVFLDNDVYHYGDYDIIGSTLWTDFHLYGTEPIFVEKAKELVSMSLNDFRQIGFNQSYFSVEDAQQLGFKNKLFLEQALDNSQALKKIVITHHAPTKLSIAEKYKNDIINCGFINDLPQLVLKSDLWIHGHTHSSFNYKLPNSKSRVVCNPRGYSKHQHKQENLEFKLNLVIER